MTRRPWSSVKRRIAAMMPGDVIHEPEYRYRKSFERAAKLLGIRISISQPAPARKGLGKYGFNARVIGPIINK